VSPYPGPRPGEAVKGGAGGGLKDPDRRAAAELERNPEISDHYIFELNLKCGGGLPEAEKRFRELCSQLLGPDWETAREMEQISTAYYHCRISVTEWSRLLSLDEKTGDSTKRAIYRIWPDYKVEPLIDRSVATVKADAARRSFDAAGDRITWAVVDSGIDVTHLHFNNPEYQTLSDESVAGLHRDFTIQLADEKNRITTRNSALTDPFGHGTQVAGIIAGGLPEKLTNGEPAVEIGQSRNDSFRVFLRMFDYEEGGGRDAQKIDERRLADSSRLRGVAPLLQALQPEGAR